MSNLILATLGIEKPGCIATPPTLKTTVYTAKKKNSRPSDSPGEDRTRFLELHRGMAAWPDPPPGLHRPTPPRSARSASASSRGTAGSTDARGTFHGGARRGRSKPIEQFEFGGGSSLNTQCEKQGPMLVHQ